MVPGLVGEETMVDIKYLYSDKAPDIVPHDVLINKLEKCGIDFITVGQIHNWQNNHKQ